MANIYFAVPPQGSNTAPVVTGVLLRMGTYINEPTNPIDEASQMPASYTGGASASEGIFITTAGTYIVAARDEGHIEELMGVTQAISGDDGSMTTTVEQGDVSITVSNGKYSLTGKSGFDVTSDKGNISLKAENGKVSSSGNCVYTHTFGAYIKSNLGSKKSGVEGIASNVSVSLSLVLQGAVLIAVKVCTIGFKLYSTSATLVVAQLNGIAIDLNASASTFVGEDDKYSMVYVKYRSIQLEYALVKDNTQFLGSITGNAYLYSGLGQTGSSLLKMGLGMEAKFPKPVPPPRPPVLPTI